jgi:hypothetical protein
MKQLILIFTIFIGLNAFSQTPPYQEFTKVNAIGTELTLHVPAGGFIWFLTHDTGTSIKTYVRTSRITAVDVTPVTPSGWFALKMYYDVDTDFKVPVSGSTDYVLGDNYENYVNVN